MRDASPSDKVYIRLIGSKVTEKIAKEAGLTDEDMIYKDEPISTAGKTPEEIEAAEKALASAQKMEALRSIVFTRKKQTLCKILAGGGCTSRVIPPTVINVGGITVDPRGRTCPSR